MLCSQDASLLRQVTASGDLFLAGFQDGSVRVFEMGATHRSDSQGCLLGYVGEIGGMRASLDVRCVSLRTDGRLCWMPEGGAKVTAWDLTSCRALRKRRGFSTAEGVVLVSYARQATRTRRREHQRERKR